MKPLWRSRTLIQAPYLTLCTTPAMFTQVCRHLDLKNPPSFVGSEHADATTHEMLNPEGKQVFVVCIRAKPDVDGIQIAALLVHEAMHIWRSFREAIGETEPSSEFEAYSVQFLSQELMYEYARQTVIPARKSAK